MIVLTWITLSIAVMAILFSFVAMSRANKAIAKADCNYTRIKTLKDTVSVLSEVSGKLQTIHHTHVKSTRDNLSVLTNKVKKLNLKVFSNKAEKDAHCKDGITKVEK